MGKKPVRVLLVACPRTLVEQVRESFAAAFAPSELSVVRSPQAAEDYVGRQATDVVVVDTDIADNAAASLLPDDPTDADYPLVALLDRGDEEAIAAVTQAGALDYCVKSSSGLADLPHVVSRAVREWTHVLERRRAEQARRVLEAQLQQAQKLGAIGTLASSVAHDFNNLLTAIVGYAELARAAMPDNSEAARPLQGVLDAAEQASGVTQSLLTFSRRTQTRKVPVHVGHLITAMQRMLRQMLPASIELETNVAQGGGLWMRADGAQLQQLVINLVVNAREAMPDGGTLDISVGPEPADESRAETDESTPGSLVLVVADSGQGLGQEIRERLAHAIPTPPAPGSGAGLGMAVAHGIVAEHGGRIEVESREGRGTRIIITFPGCQRPPQRLADRPWLTEDPGHGETILVAENTPQILAIVTSALRSKGYRVLQASDGCEASELHEKHRATTRLLILDADLPNKGGTALLHDVRASGSSVPAILITGRPDPAVQEDALPGLHVLRKPFHVGSLVSLVSTVLREQAPARP